MRLEMFKEICRITLEDCVNLMVNKNEDYAVDDDAFKNLTVHAKIIKLLELDCGDRLHQPLSHIIEKVHRIVNLMNKKQKPKNESVMDSLDDIIVFALLFKGMWLEDMNEEKK